jgi:glycosyltransferase involved in cell wall biosynthesis
MRRPRLLFLCQTLPYPPDGGVWIRTYHVLRLLARTFEITALCFERSGTSLSGGASNVAASSDALGRLADIEVFTLPQNHSGVRFMWDHVRSIASGRTYTTYRYDSRAFHRRLTNRRRSEQFDLVHVDSLDLARYLPACSGLPIVCVHHDIESDLLRRRAVVERRRWRSIYLWYQSRLMEAAEHRWCGRVALNVVMSERDLLLLRRIAQNARIAVVPNGVDIDAFRPDGVGGAGVAYVGGTSPAANLDALEFFCEEILPHLRRLTANVPVRWIGRASTEQQRRYRGRYGVELTGYVEDVRPFMREAACHIVPLRVGGGTRLKILNAWAAGKAVVSTSIGCEGLEAIDGTNVLIRDDPREFAQAVSQVLSDSTLRGRLGERGRQMVEQRYSWDLIGERMTATYRGLLASSPSERVLSGSPVRPRGTCRQVLRGCYRETAAKRFR